MPLPTFEIEPTEPQRGTVIWLHGLGASHHDFLPVVPELGVPFLRFVFPAAPVRRLTISRGMRMPAWYDILSFEGGAPREDEAQLRESMRELEQLMARERERGVGHDRIVLAGFSQGGAMVLHLGLRCERRLGGVLVMSGYLPAAHALRSEARPERRDTPILFCHGRRDPVVPRAGGRMSHTLVREAGFTAEWAEFDVAHTLDLDEVRFIGAWLAQRFPAASPLAPEASSA